MPKCQGLPDGRCPRGVNNRTVKSTQGDLFLCPSCEAVRFPYVATKADVTPPPSDRSKSGATRNKHIASVDTADGTDKNNQVDRTNKNSHSDDEHDCTYCGDTVTSMNDSIRCDVCKSMYHQHCTGLSVEVFAVLTNIISQAGWVCRQCRTQFDGLKVALAKTNEELADMRTSLAYVIEEVNKLKNTPCKQPSGNTAPVQNEPMDRPPEHSSSYANTSTADPVTSNVRLEIHRTIQDVARRKCNVVVTGIPESLDGTTTIEADNTAFNKFCEENLSVKPALARRGCVRLGKLDGQRPRRMLVHLTSDTSAANILRASKALRQSEDTYVARNVFFNPDLTQLEAKLAYEKREERRRRRRAAPDAAVPTVPLNVNAEPYGADLDPTNHNTVDQTCRHTAPSLPETDYATLTNPGQVPFLRQSALLA